MEGAYWMGKGKTIEAFPMLKTEGLVGGVVYYDGESAAQLAANTPAIALINSLDFRPA